MGENLIPTYDRLMNPLLKALRDLGGSGTTDEIFQRVSENLNLPEEVLSVLHSEKSSQTEIQYRLAWAQTYLKKFGFLENRQRGVWSLTKQAEATLEVDPKQVQHFVRELDEKERGETADELEDSNEAKAEAEDDKNVIDESAKDDTVPKTRYEINSFGADYDVAGLVKRLSRGDIFIPSFQRDYVWKLPEASKFIESLLLGLPVPGVFLARDPDTNKLLVIDGQQRLKSLQFFYEGTFNPKDGDKTRRVFKLSKVSDPFEGLTYQTLPERDRIQLDDYILHATVVKQESPKSDDTSIYHVFERLNTGGQKLKPQEIRVAVYHGSLMNLIDKLNNDSNWRAIYGKPSPRLKDAELVLRFLAFYYNKAEYRRPLYEFLNKFSRTHQNPALEFLAKCETKFSQSIEVAFKAFGEKAFKPEGSLNAAVYDSVLVAIAHRLDAGPIANLENVRLAYAQLLEDKEFQSGIERASADEANVAVRIRRATETFAGLP